MELDDGFISFLIRAKQSTYAAVDTAPVARASSRPNSHDLGYQEGDLLYLDTYLGGFSFGGEEAVWRGGTPLWAMNYYGTMNVAAIPAGFSDFLKQALRQVPAEAPFRGPREFSQGEFAYRCRWEGGVSRFRGEEIIYQNGQEIYALYFHGGVIQ